MSFFPTQPIYVGIDVSKQTIRLAHLRRSRKGWEVLHLKTFAHDEPVNLLDMGVFVSALPSLQTLVRSCELHIKKEKDIKAALDFQIDPLLPYSVDKAITQAQPIEKKVNGILLTAFAVRQDHLQTHLESMNQKGFEPEKVTCVPYALAALSTLFPQTNSPQFLVHEGEEEVTCILVERGKLLATRAFDHTRNLGTEVQKTILSFSSTHKTKTFETLLLLGKESEAIQKATGKMVLFPSTSVLPLSQEELIRYGLAIGIALAAEGIDFRQKHFAYPHKWRRVKKPLLACLAFSFLLIGTLFGFGQAALQQKKLAIEHAYLSLLKAEGKAIDEKEFPSTPYGYFSSLNKLEKEISTRPDTFPLLPAIPSVREFLTWLSSQQEIQLESFHYALVKRPDFSHKKEHYKVKVELEFSTLDISTANAFHDRLASKNSFIDPKEELLWNVGKGKYRTSFYLKDKTQYY